MTSEALRLRNQNGRAPPLLIIWGGRSFNEAAVVTLICVLAL